MRASAAPSAGLGRRACLAPLGEGHHPVTEMGEFSVVYGRGLSGRVGVVVKLVRVVKEITQLNDVMLPKDLL